MNDLPWPVIRKGYSASMPWYAIRCMGAVGTKDNKPWGVLHQSRLRYFSDEQMSYLGGDELNTDQTIQLIEALNESERKTCCYNETVKSCDEAVKQLGEHKILLEQANKSLKSYQSYCSDLKAKNERQVDLVQDAEAKADSLAALCRSLSSQLAAAKKKIPKPRKAVTVTSKKKPAKPVKKSMPKSAKKAGKSGKKC